MLDIGFYEFFLAAAITLLVVGPERLPGALRALALWTGRLRRSYHSVKADVEREIGMDDVRRQLHNEQLMADIQRVERDARDLGNDVHGSLSGAAQDASAARREPQRHGEDA